MLKGNYDFNIKTILQRASKLSLKNNWTVAQGLICILLISLAVYMIFLKAYGIEDISKLIDNTAPLTMGQQGTIEIILTILLAPLWTGVAMLSIWTARKQQASVTSIFSFFKILPSVAIASAIISLTFTMGIVLYVLPGFYIFTATTFTLPLIVDKNMKPLSAIMYSIKMVNAYLIKMLLLYGIFLCLLVLVLISFGFAYLWVGPFYLNVKAILYQDLFCAKQEDESSDAQSSLMQETNKQNTDDGVFDA